MTIAKGITSGYQPLGGAMVSDRVADVLIEKGGEFAHGFTWSGHPVCCAVAIENLNIMRREKIVERVRDEIAPYFQKRIRELADHRLVGEVRGVGMLGAIELVAHKGSRTFFRDRGAVGLVCRDHCFKNGLIMRAVRDTMITGAAARHDEGRRGRAGRESQALPRPDGARHRRRLKREGNMPRAIRIWPVVAADHGALLPAAASKRPEPRPRPPAPEEKAVNVLNWSDYIAETTVADFQEATGHQGHLRRLRFERGAGDEAARRPLGLRHRRADRALPRAADQGRRVPAARQVEAAEPFKNMDPEIMQRVAAHDPGNQYSMTYLWGTIGLGYNPDMVKKALGTDTIDSWSACSIPANATKLAKCGIAMLDAPTDVFGSVAIYLGLDPNSEKPEDLKAVEDALMKVRPHIRYFHSSSYINDLAAGEICLALGWSGDVLQARDRGAAAAKPVRVKYAIPKEGAINYFDMLAIPADAPHPDNAHAFLNYLMEPAGHREGHEQGALREREFRGAASSSTSRIRNDPNIYPSAEVRARLHPDLSRSQAFSRELNRAWTRIRSGQ